MIEMILLYTMYSTASGNAKLQAVCVCVYHCSRQDMRQTTVRYVKQLSNSKTWLLSSYWLLKSHTDNIVMSSTMQTPESHEAISLWVAPIHLTSDTPQSAGTRHSQSLNARSFVKLLKYRSSPVHRRFVRLDAASINAPSVYHKSTAPVNNDKYWPNSAA